MGRAAFWVVCGAAPAGAGAVARAEPPPPPPPPCTFSLSTPATDGVRVSATVQSTGYAPLAAPYSSVVCLQAGGSAPSCSQARGTDPARVELPVQAGAVYVATGRGCAGWVGMPPAPDCQLLGPDSASP